MIRLGTVRIFELLWTLSNFPQVSAKGICLTFQCPMWNPCRLCFSHNEDPVYQYVCTYLASFSLCGLWAMAYAHQVLKPLPNLLRHTQWSTEAGFIRFGRIRSFGRSLTRSFGRITKLRFFTEAPVIYRGFGILPKPRTSAEADYFK